MVRLGRREGGVSRTHRHTLMIQPWLPKNRIQHQHGPPLHTCGTCVVVGNTLIHATFTYGQEAPTPSLLRECLPSKHIAVPLHWTHPTSTTTKRIQLCSQATVKILKHHATTQSGYASATPTQAPSTSSTGIEFELLRYFDPN